MSSVPEIFGSMVFNDNVMKKMLPSDVYKKLKMTIENEQILDMKIGDVVAKAMKDWAIEKGATHFTHWFQPMTGITAEKHDSFITLSENGSVIMDFSGKDLIKGEPDASSFPSGGLRATFEARGYTAWDPTSYAFIKDKTLCVPTVFCSYGGEVLDTKTPLLKSCRAINKQSMRILKLFGHDEVKKVVANVGAEQEYFIIDKESYNKRKDLIVCGRTLFGAGVPKGQELVDHYFGTIKPRISNFMKELDEELWKLGIMAKTEHSEAAPAQHELAPVYTSVNIATDHNQLIMEIMKIVADKHGLVCLLHEKPFKGINGSGKHNNWSLSTDTGLNLFEPGVSPFENAQFLLFLCAMMKGADEYQDLLRLSIATAGNDCRLGGDEAPPSIVSLFLGEELTEILEALETGSKYSSKIISDLEIGLDSLPPFKRDTSDRNRTSPIAFTGNKFEFRMVGSSASIATANIVINTIMAEELRYFADILEKSENFQEDLHNLIIDVIKNHKKIIFNGNSYSQEWVNEAKDRGLLNLESTPDAAPYYLAEKNINLFKNHRIFNEKETRSRYEIQLEKYCKVIHTEAQTMITMVKKDILPGIINYSKDISDAINSKRLLMSEEYYSTELDLLAKISVLNNNMYLNLCKLEEALAKSKDYIDMEISIPAMYYKNSVIPCMNELRADVDKLERTTSRKYWPYPSYGDMLFLI